MWAATAEGRIHHIASDHAPSTLEQKHAGSIWDAPFGLPGLDTTLPILLDGAHRDAISYERVVEAYAEAPAKTYGLFPRKGRLAVGADADIILVDTRRNWTVRDEDLRSGAAWSPYRGRTLVGGAVATYLRGTLASHDGAVAVDPGVGRYLPGAGRQTDKA
jgi:dihydroorotase-like cyclic amidohydrolase